MEIWEEAIEHYNPPVWPTCPSVLCSHQSSDSSDNESDNSSDTHLVICICVTAFCDFHNSQGGNLALSVATKVVTLVATGGDQKKRLFFLQIKLFS